MTRASNDEDDPVFQIPIPPPASGYPLREPGPVRPSPVTTFMLRTVFWLGVISIAATVLFLSLVALFFYEWSKGAERQDIWELANARDNAAQAEQPLRAAALDGTLTDTEIATVLHDPWVVSRSTTEVRVVKRLDWGLACSVYIVSLPLGPQTQVRRAEVPSCNLDGATYHPRPTQTPSS
jgi:hypothetical protein